MAEEAPSLCLGILEFSRPWSVFIHPPPLLQDGRDLCSRSLYSYQAEPIFKLLPRTDLYRSGEREDETLSSEPLDWARRTPRRALALSQYDLKVPLETKQNKIPNAIFSTPACLRRKGVPGSSWKEY